MAEITDREVEQLRTLWAEHWKGEQRERYSELKVRREQALQERELSKKTDRDLWIGEWLDNANKGVG